MENRGAKRRLEVGEVIRLDAVYIPKRKQVGFMPVFIDDDLLVRDQFPGACYMGSRRNSVRIFVPVNRCNLSDGEEWEAEISKVKVTEKLTRDYRYKIYINVKVMKRVEKIMTAFDLRGLWIEETTSGREIVRRIETPAERRVRNYFSDGNVFVVEEIVAKTGKFFQKRLLEKLPTDEFVRNWCLSFNVPRVKLDSLIAAARKFPAPPPEILLQNPI